MNARKTDYGPVDLVIDGNEYVELRDALAAERAAREAAEARVAALNGALADLVDAAFTTHRTATHKLQPMYCETCQESTRALEHARALLTAGEPTVREG